jgi:hypothetical protein
LKTGTASKGPPEELVSDNGRALFESVPDGSELLTPMPDEFVERMHVGTLIAHNIIRISSRFVKKEEPARLEDFGLSNNKLDELLLMDRFANLRLTVYKYDAEKVPESDGGWRLGFIAEEVAELFPKATTEVTLKDGSKVPAIKDDELAKYHMAATQQLVKLTASMRSNVRSIMVSMGNVGRAVNGIEVDIEELNRDMDTVKQHDFSTWRYVATLQQEMREMKVRLKELHPHATTDAVLQLRKRTMGHTMEVLRERGGSSNGRSKWHAAAASLAATITGGTATPYMQFLRDAPQFLPTSHAVAKTVTVYAADWGELTQALTVKHRHKLASQNTHFAVHSVVSATQPGGGYCVGGSGQEANMWRRTDCHHWMDSTATTMIMGGDSQRIKNLIAGKTVHHINARVCIKGSEDGGQPKHGGAALVANPPATAYRLLDGKGPRAHPFLFYLLESAPIDTSQKNGRGDMFSGEAVGGISMAAQIDNLMCTCAANRTRHLVLSPFAWQWGARADLVSAQAETRSAIRKIAAVFYQQLTVHSSKFDVVALAIDEHEHGKGTFALFQQAWAEAHSRSIDEQQQRQRAEAYIRFDEQQQQQTRVQRTRWACCACL